MLLICTCNEVVELLLRLPGALRSSDVLLVEGGAVLLLDDDVSFLENSENKKEEKASEGSNM